MRPLVAETAERVARLLPGPSVVYGRPSRAAGWLRIDELVGDGGLLLDERLAAMAERGSSRLDVAGSWLLLSATSVVARPLVAALLSEGRVPDLAPANLALHLHRQGWLDRLALRSPAMAVLPADPAVGRPWVTVAPDLAVLRQRLAGGLVSHLHPLVEALRPRTRRGPRALWGLVADACAYAVIGVTHALGRPATWPAEAGALLAAAPALRGTPRHLALEHAGTEHLFLRRSACCFAYRDGGYGFCATCPLLSEAEQQRRLLAALANAEA